MLAVRWGCLEVHEFFGRRKFRSQTSENMDRWKAEMGRVREKRRVEERRSEKRKSQKKEDADARKGRKVAKHSVFPIICGSGESKSRLAKAAGAEPSGQMTDDKLHAIVARSTFRSQNVQNTPGPDHLWKCWKQAEDIQGDKWCKCRLRVGSQMSNFAYFLGLPNPMPWDCHCDGAGYRRLACTWFPMKSDGFFLQGLHKWS